MSSPIQNSRTPPVDGHDNRTLPQHNPTATALNPNTLVISDSNPGDWVQQELRKLGYKDAKLRTFLADYDQYKNARLEGLFQSMVATSYFDPSSSYYYWAPTNIIGEDTERSYPSASPTFSQALDQFRDFLRKGKPGCARFCILSFSDDHSIQSKAVPFNAKLFATVTQLERKYMVPLAAILLVVTLQWQLSDNVIDDCNIDSETKQMKVLFSSRQQQPLQTVLIDQRKKTTSEKLSLKLEWLAHSPRYKGMVSTYIWRPYILPPRTINADIRIRTDSQGSHNVLVHLQGWDHSKGALDKYKWNSIAGPSTYTRISSNPDREIQLHLYAMLKQLIMDSNTFVKTAYEEVTNLTYDGRKSPGNEKLYFLLHFGDCCRHASSGLAQATSFLEQRPQGEGPDKTLETWFGQALKDIDTLRVQLDEIETQILSTRTMIKDQLDLRNGRRTGLVGLLAAIYIPFAFLSSLFGMNIKDPIWGPIIPQGVENELSDNSSALENSTTAIARNQTDAITSAIATSGGYLWSFKIYWTIAAPVTFVTILLPLIAGPAARYIVKFSYHNRAYSRIILSLLGVAGEIIMAIFVPVLAYLLIFGLAYGALAVTMLFWTSASGQNPLLWATFAAVYAYSLLLDLSVEKLESVPVTGVVPLIFLIIVLFQSDIRRFLPARGHKCIAALLSNTARQRRKLCWVGIIVYYILVSVLITFASSVTWQIIIIPLLILAINRLVYEWTHEGRINHWFCYAVLLSISAVTDSFTIVWLLPYLPMTYIFTVWVIQEHKGDFLKVLRRIRN